MQFSVKVIAKPAQQDLSKSAEMPIAIGKWYFGKILVHCAHEMM